MTTVLVGIDGTGPMLDSTYGSEFRSSFVRRLCAVDDPTRLYMRGPSGSGGGLIAAVERGFEFVREAYRPDTKVLLTGYSRGALGALVIAQRLGAHDIPVHALMMFDAVDRHPLLDADVVPPTVANVLHVMRDPGSGSRNSFGNCGILPSSMHTRYTSRTFMGTHGAMGGTPWAGTGEAPGFVALGRGASRVVRGTRPHDYIYEGFPDERYTNITYAADSAMANIIWCYVQPFLRRHGFIAFSDVPDLPDDESESW